MAHNVPCPSCGTELAVEVAVTPEPVDHRQRWTNAAELLELRGETARAESIVPVASDDLANAEWIDPKSTPEFALPVGTYRPRHLAEPVVITKAPAMVLDPDNAETPLSWADESPPALAPTERKYLLEVTATYEAGEPISNDDEFALFVWLKLRDRVAPGQDRWDSGITMVNPWIRVELDAYEPPELLRNPATVYVRKTTRPADQVDTVEVCGVPSLVEDFIADNWSSEEADQVIANYKAGL